MFVICKHAASITLRGWGEASFNPGTSTLWKNLGWNYHLPTQTAREDTFTSDLMASMMAPNFSLPSEWQPAANQSPRLGQQLHGKHSFNSRCWTPLNQQGFETWNFHKKKWFKVQDLRSAHKGCPTFSTTSLYSGCCHVTTSHQTLPGGGGSCDICAERLQNHKLGLFCVHKLSSAARLMLDSR